MEDSTTHNPEVTEINLPVLSWVLFIYIVYFLEKILFF